LNSAKAADWTVNNCYTGWDGQVTLTYADRQVTISGDSNARFIQCYRPGPGSAFLALEPVTQVPNAHQLDAAGVTDTGLRYLRPAETMSVSIDIAVV
jgi:aldose 1-epimerase